MQGRGKVTDKDIYRLWLSKSKDHRYLRRNRWEEVKKVVLANKLHSVLEFGSGISSFLLSNIGLRVVSLETDPDYLKFVLSFGSNRVNFKLWDNKTDPELGKFDLAFVDGIEPRDLQLEIAVKSAKFVAIDDFVGRTAKRLSKYVENLTRIDSKSTFMAVFKNE